MNDAATVAGGTAVVVTGVAEQAVNIQFVGIESTNSTSTSVLVLW